MGILGIFLILFLFSSFFWLGWHSAAVAAASKGAEFPHLALLVCFFFIFLFHIILVGWIWVLVLKSTSLCYWGGRMYVAHL